MSPIRRSVLAAAAPALVSAAGVRAPSMSRATASDLPADKAVDDLVARATEGHAALMRGDIGRYRSMIAHSDDFTLMAPFGGKPTRANDLSNERWESIGRFFQGGRDSTLELVQAYASPGMIVLVVIERTHVKVEGIPAQDWALRVTLVFRNEKDRWRLAHRHADPLVDKISVELAARLGRGASTPGRV